MQFMGPALLGLLGEHLPPEFTPGSCVQLGSILLSERAMGWLLPDCQVCLALWLLPISLDQVFRQNRTLVCVDNTYKSHLAGRRSGKGDPLLQIINHNSLSLPLSNTVNTAIRRLSPLVQTLFLLVLSFCKDIEIDVLANVSNL